MAEFSISGKVLKVNDELGLVFGYGIICKEAGKRYFDLQGDHIPEESMLKAAADFMLNSREMDVMHDNEVVGNVVFMWPMTTDVAKAFDVKTEKTGLMVAVAPNAQTLKRFKSGELKAFSIGGERGEDEPVEDAA